MSKPFNIKNYQEEIIQALQECLKIKSISGQEEGIRQALDYYLNLGKKLGFKATNVDNLGGIIEFGEGQKTIGIIVHLDTVPEGQGWNYPPFAGQIQEGKIYGRGAIDDKGPAIAVLYALKAIKDAGIKPQCKVQIIIGIDEESVWNTTPQLLNKIREPDFSFVPDSKFPLVIAEKGLIWLEIKKNFPSISTNNTSSYHPNPKSHIVIKHLQGGSESINIVPDYCEAILEITNPLPQDINAKLKEYLREEKAINPEKSPRIELHKNGQELKIVAHGKSAHAFNCQEGYNAISSLIRFLSQLDISSEQKKFLDTYNSKIGLDCHGKALGLELEDKLTGKLTQSPGYIQLDEKSVILRVDIRFPASVNLASVQAKVLSAYQCFEGHLAIIDSLESLNFPEDEPHIQTLLKVYKDYTGDLEAKPLGMGGTTFAKAFQRAVAFGPTFPGMPKVEHQPDEYIEIEHLLKCTEIYAQAILELVSPPE
ncbi:MAG TPA: M20 family metallopeptidase [Peptococcaceae bacterium]|nr:M20 family metallopeptidase [Peptococcaceae bacterium]